MLSHRLHALLLCLFVSLAGVGWAAAAEPASAWTQLSAVQKQVLAPLEREWASIDAPHRAKWLEVAMRFPSLSTDERTRLQTRMADWARMTPLERSRARLQFQETRQLPLDERQAQWQAYQALSEDQRKALSQRAKPAAKQVSGAANGSATLATMPPGKSNLVQTTTAPRARAVTPTAQQARPGATTTTMTTRATPPAHNQPGMPKIAATKGFVDPSTLLPQRGPQGAAVRSAAASSQPVAQP